MPRKRAPFQKVLCRKQPYPDNYTDPLFPSLAQFNEGATFRSIRTCFCSGALVYNQLTVILIFLCLFVLFHEDNLIPAVSVWKAPNSLSMTIPVFVVSVICCVLALLLITVTVTELTPFYVAILVTVILSPFLQTLSDTVSTDTVYTMTTVFALIHMASADYRTPKASRLKSIVSQIKVRFNAILRSLKNYFALISINNSISHLTSPSLLLSNLTQNNIKRIWTVIASILTRLSAARSSESVQTTSSSSSLSLSCAALMTVLLASRLPSETSSTVFIAVSLTLFSVLPPRTSMRSTARLSLLSFSGTAVVVFLLKCMRSDTSRNSLLCAYGFAAFVILIVGPLGFWRIQRHKVTIVGPWTYDTTGEIANSAELFKK